MHILTIQARQIRVVDMTSHLPETGSGKLIVEWRSSLSM